MVQTCGHLLGKSTSFIQIAVIWPGVQRGEAQVTGTGATTTIRCTIGAGSVPRHTNHQTAIVAPIRWPPLLTVSHQVDEIFL